MGNSIKNDVYQLVIDEEVAFDYLCISAECLKAIAHPARLQMIFHIMKGEFTVNEISKHCELSHAQTSGHLRMMEGKRLLKRERRGRTVYYSILEPHLSNFMESIKGMYIEMKMNSENEIFKNQ